MADLKIDYANLQTAIQLSGDISKELDNSYETVNQLRNFLSSASWSGETKDAFQAYLSLIHQYHNDLKEIMKEHKKAVDDLKKTVDEYNNSTEVGSIKGL